MEISLSKDSIVNQQTGAIETPGEYVSNLREVELNIQRADDLIDTLKGQLKAARDGREELVTQLRAAVREGKVLPLLEVADAPTDNPDAGLDHEDE